MCDAQIYAEENYEDNSFEEINNVPTKRKEKQTRKNNNVTKEPTQIKRQTVSLREGVKKSPIQCEICKTLFTRSRPLKIHMRHHAEYQFTQLFCEICEIKFKTVRGMFSHIYQDHGPKPQIKCQECIRTFDKVGALNYHIEKVHQINTPCTMCGLEFPEGTILRNHWLKEHEICEPKHCEVCGQSFINKSKFWNLMKELNQQREDKY